MSERYDRLDSGGLLYTLQRIKSIFTGMFQAKEAGKGLSSNDYTTEDKTRVGNTVTSVTMNGSVKTKDAAGAIDLGTVITDVSDKAPLASPALTGTPTAPTAQTSTNNTTIANTAFVKNAIAAALDGRVELDFLFLQELPASGVKGIFYFIPNSDPSTGDVWDEYVWDSENSEFERIGSATVDLTGYFNTTNLPAVTNAQIDTILST